MFKLSTFSKVGLGAMLLAFSSILSRVMGVLRDYLFAKIFGIGAQGGIFALDAYYTAFRIPDFLYTLLIMSALSTAFIPLYTRLKKKSEQEASLFASDVLNGVSVLFIFVGGFCLLFAPVFVPSIAPGLSLESQKIAIDLTRIMLLSPIFLGVSSVLQGIENVQKRFWGMALAPLVYNLSIICAAYFFGREYGVYALAYGVVAGAFLHSLVQLPGVFHTPFRYKLRLPKWNPDTKEFIRLSVPRIFGASANQFSLLVDTFLASMISVGALSVYMYALNLQSFPYGVVAISFSIAVFSTLAEHAVSKNLDEFVSTVRTSLHTILFWAVPATLGLFLLREPVIVLILKGGAFDEAALLLTVNTFAILIWSALPQSLTPLFVRSFYALSETKIPVLISFVTVFVNVVLCVIFTQVYSFSVMGLALATLISSSLNALLLLYFLKRSLHRRLGEFFRLSSLFSIGIPALLMTFAVLLFERFTYTNLVFELLTLSVVGFCVFMGSTRLLKFRRQ